MDFVILSYMNINKIYIVPARGVCSVTFFNIYMKGKIHLYQSILIKSIFSAFPSGVVPVCPNKTLLTEI